MKRLASPPKNERKQSKKHHKQPKQKQIQSHLPIPFRIPIFFFFLLFFLLFIILKTLPPVKFPSFRQILHRRRESRRRRLPRMVYRRRMVKMVRRRPHRTRPIWHFLHVVVRWALNVVQRPPWRSRRRRLVYARYFRVRFRVHCETGEKQRTESVSVFWVWVWFLFMVKNKVLTRFGMARGESGGFFNGNGERMNVEKWAF